MFLYEGMNEKYSESKYDKPLWIYMQIRIRMNP